MRKSFTFGVKAVLFAIFFLFPCFLRAQSAIQRISATIFTRQLENGYSTSLRGGIYYRANGNMVSHFTFPKEYVVLPNNNGETRVYDPSKNSL